VDSNFLAYVCGVVSFAFSAGIVLTFFDSEFFIGLFDIEFTSGNKADHIVVHGLFYIGSARLVHYIQYLNFRGYGHVRVESAYLDKANARGELGSVIWAICRNNLSGCR
jgi:hypothetical protein